MKPGARWQLHLDIQAAERHVLKRNTVCSAQHWMTDQYATAVTCWQCYTATFNIRLLAVNPDQSTLNKWLAFSRSSCQGQTVSACNRCGKDAEGPGCQLHAAGADHEGGVPNLPPICHHHCYEVSQRQPAPSSLQTAQSASLHCKRELIVIVAAFAVYFGACHNSINLKVVYTKDVESCPRLCISAGYLQSASHHQ